MSSLCLGVACFTPLEEFEGKFRQGGSVEPVLGAMGKRWFHLGPHGAGQTVKLAMNLLLALEVEAFAEALALVTRAGLPGERLFEEMVTGCVDRVARWAPRDDGMLS